MTNLIQSDARFFMSLRREVLAFYKQVIRLSKTWQAQNTNDIQKERDYILNEARRLFRENKNLTNEDEIREKLKEGYQRVEIAKHYKIPYPRLSYFPTGSFIKRIK